MAGTGFGPSTGAATVIAALLVSQPSRAAIDCQDLIHTTRPFQLTSEDTLASPGRTKTLTVVSQVYRGPDGVDTTISASPGRKRQASSRYGIDYELKLEGASGRSFRIETLNVPTRDMLGGKRDFSLDLAMKTTTNDSEMAVTARYKFVGEGSVVVSGCTFPVLEYHLETSGLFSRTTDFAYSPDLRLRLRWTEVSKVLDEKTVTEERPIDITTSFTALPKPKP